MLNFRAAHHSGDSGDENERKMEYQNKKETYEIFAKSRKNDKSQTKNKINNEGKLDKLLIMVEQMAKDMKLLREEQLECKKEISKLREENESVRKEDEQIKVENENMIKEMQKLDRSVNYLEK